MDETEYDYAAIHERVWELHTNLRLRSANTLAHEMYERAKEDRNLDAYVDACFLVLNTSSGILESERSKRASLELISVLESRDAAVEFQPDLDDAAYRRNVYVYSACAYDNLAEAVGQLEGMNSPQLDHVLDEGIAICRRTGKTQCIGCFRAYGRMRALASDDVDMALHFARSARASTAQTDSLKRFGGAAGESAILLRLGDVEGARRALEEARGLVAGSTFEAAHAVDCEVLASTAALLAGEEPRPLEFPEAAGAPDAREYATLAFEVDQVRALELALKGDHEASGAILEEWDRQLWRAPRLDLWFEARLRLIANDLRAGRDDRAAKLAKQLRERATAARDHFTVRRLDLLESNGSAAWPHAPIAPPRAPRSDVSATLAEATEAEHDAAAASTDAAPAEPAADVAVDATPSSPVLDAVDELRSALDTARADEAELAPIEGQILALAPAADDRDGRRAVLRLIYRLEPDYADVARTWKRVRELAAGHEDDAQVLSLLASIGWLARAAQDSPIADSLPDETLRTWFDRSVELEPTSVDVRARAASYFLHVGDEKRAERLLARAARLDRTQPWVALRLSEIYGRSGRAADALAVLDLAIRAGSEDLDVVWAAVGRAAGAGENRALVSYARRYGALVDPTPWVPYYELLGLVGDERWEEADPIVATGRSMDAAMEFAWSSFEAAIAAGLGDAERAARGIGAVLQQPIRSVEFVTAYGIAAALSRTYGAAQRLERTDDMDALRARALEVGLCGVEMSSALRESEEAQKDMRYFDVQVRQPLPANWSEREQRLPETESWTSLIAEYGVLAPDRAAAERIALANHPELGPGASIAEVAEEDARYTDRPGLFRQWAFREDPGEAAQG